MAASAKPRRGQRQGWGGSSRSQHGRQGEASGEEAKGKQQGGEVDWMQEFLHGQTMEVYPLMLPESVEGLRYEEVRMKHPL